MTGAPIPLEAELSAVRKLVDATERLRTLSSLLQSLGAKSSSPFVSVGMMTGRGSEYSFAKADAGPDVSISWSVDEELEKSGTEISVGLDLRWVSALGDAGEWSVWADARSRKWDSDNFEHVADYPDIFVADPAVAMAILTASSELHLANGEHYVACALGQREPIVVSEISPIYRTGGGGHGEGVVEVLHALASTTERIERDIFLAALKQLMQRCTARPRVRLEHRSVPSPEERPLESVVRWLLAGSLDGETEVHLELALVAAEEIFRGELELRRQSRGSEWQTEAHEIVDLTTTGAVSAWLDAKTSELINRLLGT